MNEKLQKIAKILNITLASDKEVINLSIEAQLADGTIVYTEADAFVEGALVEIIAEDGSKSKAPVGEHILMDGSKIVLDEAGIIVEVMVAEEDKPSEEAEVIVEDELSKEEKSEEDKEEELEAEEDEDEMKIDEYKISEEEVIAIDKRIAALEEILLGAVEMLNTTNQELTERVEKLSAEPAAKPIKRKIPVTESNALRGLKLGRK